MIADMETDDVETPMETETTKDTPSTSKDPKVCVGDECVVTMWYQNRLLYMFVASANFVENS